MPCNSPAARPSKLPSPRPRCRTARTGIDAAFTYYPPGSLIPRTGLKPEIGGDSDATVYARLRFPMKEAPAFANSQSFNNWGDCDFTGRSPRRVRSKGASYECKVNGRAAGVRRRRRRQLPLSLAR